MEQIIEGLAKQIKEKSCTQVEAKKNTKGVFNRLMDIAFDLIKDMKLKLGEQAENAKLEVDKISEYEFQITFAGEMLVFTRHSNVFTFANEHILHKSPYVIENKSRGYFGAIMAYNFLSDSLKYKRLYDQGYLIARLFVNNENHFFVEGLTLNYEFTDVASNEISDEFLSKFLLGTLQAAVETNPIMANFEQEKQISVADKLNRTMLGNVKKVGFKFNNSAE